MILDKWAEQNGDKVLLAKLNVDDANAIATQFGVTSIPTLILFSKGKEITRAVGVQRESDLDNLIAKV
jgi:thioredoxin 1